MSPANFVGRLANQTADFHLEGSGEAAESDADAGVLVAGRYRLGPRIGSGGEGDTYRARDRTSGDAVALKIFRRTDPTVGARVRGEFEKLRSIDHPGVVRALDVGRHDGRLFLVTELVAGDSIGVIGGVTDESRRRALFATAAYQIADALAYLHARGVVHGDISPENVRIAADDRAVLIDLGAAGLVPTGSAVGTLGFAAPEALIGRISPASDLYGFGATLFYAWTGTGPFGSGVEAVSKMLSAPAPLLSSVRGGLSSRWDDVVNGLLRAAPEQRFSSARFALREMARLGAPAGENESARSQAGTPGLLLPPYPAGDPLSGIFVGRTPERQLLKRAFELLAEGVSPHAAIAVVG
ncbi:MAG: serine/threonine protein kinase, partial [Deltaproteobacteria bacterium]|nr:serine/threonine protein kinase [Deltaproteobacteria bacterium]